METIIDRIKRHEGLRLHPYVDTMGNISIGFGRNLDAVGISKAEAEMMLHKDIETAANHYYELPETIKSNCNEVRKEVIIEMIFQLGFVGTLKFRKMLKAIEANNFEGAANEMLDSRWARQTPNRCHELALVMRSGEIR
jgi:lysozyme